LLRINDAISGHLTLKVSVWSNRGNIKLYEHKCLASLQRSVRDTKATRSLR